MSNQLVYTNTTGSSLAVYGTAAEFLRAVIPKDDYTNYYSIASILPNKGLTSADAAPLSGTGDQLIGDATNHQWYLKRNDQFRLIAGVYGVNGHRDGPGWNAHFSLGGLQRISHASCVNNSGEWFVTDGQNGVIRKLVEQPDHSWLVSTFCAFNGDALVCDGVNLWAADPNGALLKIPPSGVLEYHAAPAANISGIVGLPGKLWMYTRDNAWDTFWEYNTSTYASTRLAGMTQAEINAWIVANGGPEHVDGAAIGEATFHSTGIYAVAPDLSAFYTSGGDETMSRKTEVSIVGGVNTGTVKTLCMDGTYKTNLSVRFVNQSQPYDPNYPQYISQASGPVTAGGLPLASRYIWIPSYTHTWYGTPTLVPTGIVTYNSVYVTRSVPASMLAGHVYACSVTMQNTGDLAWTIAEPNPYWLGIWTPRDLPTWNLPNFSGIRVAMTHDVQPGDSYTWNFNVTAPATAGTYNMQFRVLQEQIRWIGDTTPLDSITVTAEQVTPVIASMQLKLT